MNICTHSQISAYVWCLYICLHTHYFVLLCSPLNTPTTHVFMYMCLRVIFSTVNFILIYIFHFHTHICICVSSYKHFSAYTSFILLYLLFPLACGALILFYLWLFICCFNYVLRIRTDAPTHIYEWMYVCNIFTHNVCVPYTRRLTHMCTFACIYAHVCVNVSTSVHLSNVWP